MPVRRKSVLTAVDFKTYPLRVVDDYRFQVSGSCAHTLYSDSSFTFIHRSPLNLP